MSELSHVNADGKVNMVDVSAKPNQKRIAKATGFIRLAPETVQLVRENGMKKGDVLTIAEIAGIMAGKKTSELIPLCHPLEISKVEVRAQLEDEGVRVNSELSCVGKTGIEREALTAVSVALLTVYDMCKAVDKNMQIVDIHLIEKTKIDL